MFGLIVSDPSGDAIRRHQLQELLHQLDLPLSGFTAAPSPLPTHECAAFLHAASAALMRPGTPLPLAGLAAHLPGHPLPANVLRRYLFLQLSLLPYLRPGRPVKELPGCFLVGDDLLVVPVSPGDTVDAQLPPGVWTELGGRCHEGQIRGMRGYNEMPVLARANALLPIGVNDRATNHDDADRLTLHWYEPDQEACCTLADGTWYRAVRDGAAFRLSTSSIQPCHLIVHQGGTEQLIR